MSMKIDQGSMMPSRISMNVTTPKQTQGKTFGESMAGGLQAAGNLVGQGASLVGSVMPGAGVVSAAVSSVGALANSGGGAAAASYAASGVIGLQGGGNAGMSGTGTGGLTVGNAGTGTNLLAGANAGIGGAATNSIADMSAQNAQMLNVQIAMQRENTMFSSISNVLKTKHDTAKNSVGNIR
ncbi:MAG: hypothetical protein DI536_26210 [Archangium gephyra]|uniref:Uncharacterized protein n=1 Tax=Archangium gephyra TaxID=48 RepID=A0A2W5VCQ8_9BACT|nr:MAG: hypothetical protein DI536_26210 [Archangium gephyra]